MPRWALVVEQTTGSGDQKRWAPRVLDEIVGTHDQAMTKLAALSRTFTPEYPRMSRRRMLLRNEDTYLLIVKGWSDEYHCLFRVWELLADSDRPDITG